MAAAFIYTMAYRLRPQDGITPLRLVLTFVLDHIVIWSGASTFGWGALIGLSAWLAFVAAINVPQYIYENRPFKLFAINNGYWLIGLIVAGGILAIWH